ncbi:hypothetical protein DSECCO2_370310 [anaerobic digester metagenome]
MKLILKLLFLFLVGADPVLGIHEIVGERGDLLGLQINFCKFLQQRHPGLDQCLIMQHILAAADHLLFLSDIVFQARLHILQLFLVKLGEPLLVGDKLLVVLCVVLFFLTFNLGVERFDDLMEPGNHNPAFLDDILDDQGTVFHLLAELNLLIGGQQALLADFPQIKTDRIIAAGVALVGSQDGIVTDVFNITFMVVKTGNIDKMITSTNRIIIGSHAAPGMFHRGRMLVLIIKGCILFFFIVITFLTAVFFGFRLVFVMIGKIIYQCIDGKVILKIILKQVDIIRFLFQVGIDFILGRTFGKKTCSRSLITFCDDDLQLTEGLHDFIDSLIRGILWTKSLSDILFCHMSGLC